MHALESAKPVKLRMPGMQQFAAAVSVFALCLYFKSAATGCARPWLHISCRGAGTLTVAMSRNVLPVLLCAADTQERCTANTRVRLCYCGMTQMCAAMISLQIWERRRRIPSATFNDPLDHIFTEFDEDNDGHLTATEIAHALTSRGVEAEEAQVQEFIDGELALAASLAT